ncbi:hypothetical protein [Turneriella parva]|uniref:Glycosyltransferase RgtA/B/C/D-like domain-containing protein n=1 Tax=Turneriella parva (strain ATCC BAA-1111 / DSM 21527 / NCTC 11395 / H) TaxID=869212 RepID=I4BBC9_TURPD|nr:hypothetical protein [Turneriella parva]AFM14586.1 hypothetical protein Turpa_3952 [Turneriella parva DSM 21527]
MSRLKQALFFHRYLVLLLVGFVVMAQVFPLRVQAVEPYTYAAGVEGYYNIATTFATAQPDKNLPNFSRYHPNHPLLHLATGYLHDLTGIGGMELFKAFNLLAALSALVLVYLLVLQLDLRRETALLTTLATLFMYAFWVGALSAEVHLPAVALQLLSVRYLVKYLQSTAAAHRHLRVATLFFALATAVHLATCFWGFAFAAAVLSHKAQSRLRIWAECALIYSLIMLLVYGLMLVTILKIDSFDLYKATMFIYSHLLHVRYSGLDWLVTLVKAFAQSMVFGFGIWPLLLKILWGGFVVAGLREVWRSKNPTAIKVLILVWPVAYVASHAIFGARADSIHSWLFTLPALLLAFAFLLDRVLSGAELRVYAIAALLLVGTNNFIFGVLPNSLLQRTDYQFVEDPQVLLAGNEVEKPDARQLPVLILMKYPAVTFADIWYLGSRLGYKNQLPLVYCCGKQGYREILRGYIERNAEFFLVADEIGDEVPQLLSESGRSFRLLLEKRGEITRNSLVSSLYFERPAGHKNLKELQIYFATSQVRVSPQATGR